MSYEKEIRDHFLHGQERYLRHLSIECIIFGFHTNELKVLLLHYKHANLWALPGGYVLKEEHMDDAAKRILKERTGLKDIYMQQFHVFSKPDRPTCANNQSFLAETGVAVAESWMFERFVTVGYAAMVDFSKVRPVADVFSRDADWFSVKLMPALALDHGEIVIKALENLRVQLNYQPIGYNLLPQKFTMPELQKLYETILDRPLDRRNFQRKIVGTGILKRLPETKTGVAHKAPYLYKFVWQQYKKALKGGMGFQL